MKFVMTVLLFAAATAATAAYAQSRHTDPCYAYRPEELAQLPPGYCAHVYGGASTPQRSERREQPERHERNQRDSYPELTESRPSSRQTSGNASEAVALARRLHSRAIRESETQLARGRRVRGANQELLQQASEVVAKLRAAKIEDGGDQCLENPNGDAYSPYNGDTIYVCPRLATRSGRNRDKEVIFILVHEAAHLWGEEDEGMADDIAGTILGYSLQ